MRLRKVNSINSLIYFGLSKLSEAHQILSKNSAMLRLFKLEYYREAAYMAKKILEMEIDEETEKKAKYILRESRKSFSIVNGGREDVDFRQDEEFVVCVKIFFMYIHLFDHIICHSSCVF